MVWKEAREIEEALKRSNKREQFDFIQKTAVRAQDLRRGLLDATPQIVHFSGHGDGKNGIVLEDDLSVTHMVSTEALAELFALCKGHVECVLLNACYSEEQANVIVKHIPYVIGMDQSISDTPQLHSLSVSMTHSEQERQPKRLTILAVILSPFTVSRNTLLHA